MSGAFLTRGHAAASAAIGRIVAAEHPPHALLLVGPRGVGKTTLALDLAAGLLCLEDDAAVRPCRRCVACRKVATDNHPDLHRIAPEGAGEQIRISQVQALTMDLALLALEGRFRVAIVRSAHRLNPDAQNGLLKTLEEPGPRTCLVLCADDSALLLPTLLSRVARLRLAPLHPDVLTALLVERSGVAPAQARALALAARGCPGVAFMLADRPDAIMARARVGRTLLDLLRADRRIRLSAAADLMADGSSFDAAVRGEMPSSAVRLQPTERRRAVAAVLDAWRDLGRDLAVVAHGRGRGVRDVDLLDELLAAARDVDATELTRFLDRLDGMAMAVESYANPELVLDSLLLAWPRSRRVPTTQAA